MSSPDGIAGWAFSEPGVKEIRLLRRGSVIARSAPSHDRADVRAAYPDRRNSLHSGFGIALQREMLDSPTCLLDLEFVHADGRVESAASIELYVPSGRLGEPDTGEVALCPFPAPVLRILGDLRGESHYQGGDWNDARIDEAIADLRFIVRHGPKPLPGLYHYLGWIRATWERFQFNERHFPRRNPQRSSGGEKDFCGVASSAVELLGIAHHLYVLRSRGVDGDLLEFGCFKGFSTSCLSHACRSLGIRMQVFDSFAGLPSSDSVYHREGDFAGSFEEVGRNVREYGAADVVTYHRGFFSDTLPGLRVEPLCIWMDVDLLSSSRDVMSIVEHLPPQSCVFSHECWPDHFQAGGIVPGDGPDAVIPPILDGFARVGRSPVGRFVGGNTGAFWDRSRGVPVLPAAAVLQLNELA